MDHHQLFINYCIFLVTNYKLINNYSQLYRYQYTYGYIYTYIYLLPIQIHRNIIASFIIIKCFTFMYILFQRNVAIDINYSQNSIDTYKLSELSQHYKIQIHSSPVYYQGSNHEDISISTFVLHRPTDDEHLWFLYSFTIHSI